MPGAIKAHKQDQPALRTPDGRTAPMAKNIYHVSTLGNGSSDSIDLPIISLVRMGLFPIGVAAFVLFLSLWDRGAAPGSYAIASVFAFLLSTLVFDKVNFYRASREFPVRIAFYNVLARWLIMVATVGVLASTTGFHSHFSSGVIFAWLILTPFFLLGSQMLARSTLRAAILATRTPRTGVIVGATPLSASAPHQNQSRSFSEYSYHRLFR